MRVMRANEFENTFDAACSISPVANLSLEIRNRMPTRSEKTVTMAMIIHLKNLYDNGLDSSLFLSMTLENATMLQPSISVVRVVARAWMAYWELIRCENRKAPALPRRYPTMFTIMRHTAVKSTLKPRLRHISSAIIIVRRVSSSSSSAPESLHVKAVAACSRANICIIHPVFICSIYNMVKNLPEGRNYLYLLQPENYSSRKVCNSSLSSCRSSSAAYYSSP